MQSSSWTKRVTAAAVVGGIALLLAGNAHADFTWNGSGISDLWTEGANWVGGIAPPLDVTGQGLIFGPTGVAQAPDAAADNYLDVGSIAFTGADFSLTLIGTGTLSFSDGATITNDSVLIQAINIDLIGNGASLVLDAAAGDLNIGGAIDLSDTDGVELSVLGANDVVLNGIISGSGGSLLKQGAGMLTLSRANTYTGGTTLTQGTIVLGHDNALGTGDLTLAGANTAIQSNNNARDVGNNIVNGGNLLTVSGTNDLTLSGVISGTGGLTLDSSGSLTLAGVNTYIGDTEINSGELILEGSVAGVINVNDGGTLSGGGSLGGTIANRDGGTISPGDGIGTLTVGGRYEQLAGSTLLVELNADDGSSDLLEITEDATLNSGSVLHVVPIKGSVPQVGQQFVILTAGLGITDLGVEVICPDRYDVSDDFTNGDTTLSITVLALSCVGDLTGPGGVPDGCVDAFDLGAMLGAWCSAVNDPNPPSPPCENCSPANLALADISGAANVADGCVDAFDLAKLLAAWCSFLGGNPCGTCFP